MKKLPISTHNNRAFSLIEVLVAITILLLVAVTPMAIVTRANNSTSFANEQMIAFFLAQEGLELVEKGRNDLYLQYYQNQINGSGGVTNPMTLFSRTTSTGPFSGCYHARGCGLIFDGTNISNFICNTTNSNCRIYKNGNRYVQASSQPEGSSVTPYTRVVKMRSVMDGSKLREVEVVSTVTWRTGSLIAGQRVELVTYLTNIYDTP
jgi:prepilin-type N-terminal cleavage/methylation domain-containing protein